MIELVKNNKHCTLSLQCDLFGKFYVHHLVSRKFGSFRGVWTKTYEFNDEPTAIDQLFLIEVRYRNRGYGYVN
jgi:hypothetical protein